MQPQLKKAAAHILAASCLFAYALYFSLAFTLPHFGWTVHTYEPNPLIWAAELALFIFSMIYALHRFARIIIEYRTT